MNSSNYFWTQMSRILKNPPGGKYEGQIDSGLLIIGDPGYIMPDDQYYKYVAELQKSKSRASVVAHFDTFFTTMFTIQGTGGDYPYTVTHTLTKDGLVDTVTIKFNRE